MLCPLKFTLTIRVTQPDGSYMDEVHPAALHQCDKEKCAWWSEIRTEYYSNSQGRQAVSTNQNCAIKLIAEGGK